MKLDEVLDRSAGFESAQVVETGFGAGREALTFPQVRDAAQGLAKRLIDAGLEPGHVVGLQAANGLDWVVWDLALLSMGALAEAYPDGVVPAQLDPVRRPALFVNDDGDGSSGGFGSEVPTVPVGVARRPDEALPACAPDAAREEGVHSLVFSSGTTGRLKGLRISAAGSEWVIASFIDAFGLTADDSHMIFLPLANYQQRLAIYACLWTGADVILTPYQRVFRSLKEERPTFLIAPPIFYDTVQQLQRAQPEGVGLGDLLGGGIRFVITGMAPIRRTTLDAYWAAGVPLLEAYGTTETGMIAWNTEAHVKPGTVGRLINPGGVALADDGEVIVTQPVTLSIDYFDSDPEEAARTFLPDGTIATGDVGVLDEDGFLRLTGRKKDLIALASGRKIQPLELEQEMAVLPGVDDVVVIPNRAGTALAAVVTTLPDATEDDVRKAIEARNGTVESAKRVTRVVFTPESVRGEQRFMTKNMKLHRGAVAEAFWPEVDG